jgi:hypothetical protein
MRPQESLKVPKQESPKGAPKTSLLGVERLGASWHVFGVSWERLESVLERIGNVFEPLRSVFRHHNG